MPTPKIVDRAPGLPRREFLQSLGAGALGLALAGRSAKAQSADASGASGSRALRGVFPIAETPFTPDNKLDLDGLASEVAFCNKGGIHGLMWPQMASGWNTMSEEERLAGAEAMLAAGKGGRTALVIGVQGADMDAVTRYARHAAAHGADAIISLPPAKVTDPQGLLDYYKAVGQITDLPLFAQCVGDMSVDLVVRMVKEIPTLRYVKDEAGVPLQRIGELRKRTHGELNVFSGQGVQTYIRELELGFVGCCPYTGLGDVYAQTYDLWQAGRHREAYDMFGRILAFGSLGQVNQNRLLIHRGVFKADSTFRTPPRVAGPAGGPRGRAEVPLSDHGVEVALKEFLQPYLRA